MVSDELTEQIKNLENSLTTLKKGKYYVLVNDLVFYGWTNKQIYRPGRSYLDHFSAGTYLGPDDEGVEPLFKKDSVQEG